MVPGGWPYELRSLPCLSHNLVNKKHLHAVDFTIIALHDSHFKIFFIYLILAPHAAP